MKFDAGEVGEEDERGFLSGDDVVLFFSSEDDGFDPIRTEFWFFFLEKFFAVDAIRKADDGKGAAFEVGEDGRRDGEVVFDELGFSDLVFRKEDFLEVRKLEFAFADLDVVRGAGHIRGNDK